MRSTLAAVAQRRAGRRTRSNSLNTVPPAQTSNDYLPELAAIAASILYRSPLPSAAGLPIYVVNAAAFPDSFEVDYDSLLPYVLARLPGEEELLSGQEYEVVFFAGGQPEGATTEKKQGPGIGWYLQAYHVLSRATRKKLQKLYIVHPRTWVRVLVGVFGTIVSPKFRRKIVHVNTLTGLALHIPVEKLLIPPPVYLHDRKLTPEIFVPYATGRRAFGVRHPFPKNINTGATSLPRVLRETTSFLLLAQNVKTEGLFRIPPHSILAGALKEAYDRGQRFIVWKEKGTCVVEPGMPQALLDEIRLEDAYGVHLAAALIKTWYRELREPIFPESCYDELRRKYSDPTVEVTPEDLVDMVYPASPNSPLSTASRVILTRHLLPMLSIVARNEPQNKMNAENLAICFAMALVCGSDQMEDAKMTSIIRRVLEPAIAIWPQLRDGMGIDGDAFAADLRAPTDLRDYEDPLEDGPAISHPSDDGAEDGHRIVMTDAEEAEAQPTKLPPRLPRRQRASSAAAKTQAAMQSLMVNPMTRARAPSAERRSPPSARPASRDAASASPVKRKPAPPIVPVVDPPRYSTVFDTDGNSIVADSPASYSAPVNGFRPSRETDWPSAESEKKGFPVPTFPEPKDPHPALVVPKRKAVSTEQSPADDAPTDVVLSNVVPFRSRSEGTCSVAKLAAQKAAAGLAQKLVPPSQQNGNSELRHEKSEDILAQGDGMFRKPTWPASVRPSQSAKPGLPPRQSQTMPIPSTTAGQLSAPNVPRPRAPSPGLAKRMENIESMHGTAEWQQRAGLVGPKKLNLKKASVDDLRRLYEERASTAQSLAAAEAARRGSAQS